MSFRRLAAFVVALIATGCDSSDPMDGPYCYHRDKAPYDRRMAGDGGTLFQAGQTQELVFQTGVGALCDMPALEGPADITLTAPDGQVSTVQGTWSSPEKLLRKLSWTFQPTAPGWYRLRAPFPEGTIPREFVRDLFVVQPGPLQPVAQLATGGCGRLARTTRGSWVCGQYAYSESGGATQLLRGWDGPVVSGNVAWAWHDNALVRWVDTAAGWVESARVTFSQVGTLTRMSATENALFVRTWYGLDRYRYVGPSSIVRDRISLVEDPARDVLLTDGSAVFVATAGASGTSVCRFIDQAGAFVADPAGCSLLPGEWVGTSHGGLWLESGDAFSLTYARFDGGTWKIVARAPQPLATTLSRPAVFPAENWTVRVLHRYALPQLLTPGLPVIIRSEASEAPTGWLVPVLPGDGTIQFVAPSADPRLEYGVSEPGGYFGTSAKVSVAITQLFQLQGP